MIETTIIIKTIGRKTLKNAIRSSKREGFKTFVISDGKSIDAEGADHVIKLGRQWGFYGGMAANVGAAVAPTEFITFLDDDDEFVLGAGDIIRKNLNLKKEVDIWAAGIRFKKPVRVMLPSGVITTHDLSVDANHGVVPGNVAMPTYRTSIFSKIPFTDSIPLKHQPLIDFIHVETCVKKGYKINWFGEVIYLVRPESDNSNGRGI